MLKFDIRYPYSLLGAMVLMVFAFACRSVYDTNDKRWNLAAIYNPAASSIHPSYSVYHISDNNSLLLIKLFPSELLFNQANESGEFIAKVEIEIQNYHIGGKKPVMVDSATYYYDIKQKSVGRRFLAQIPFQADTGNIYQLRIVAHDRQRESFNLQYLNIDKRSVFSHQNFRIVNQNNIPYFNNVLTPGANYKIEHRIKTSDTLFVEYFSTTAPNPTAGYPTYTDETIFKKPDSVFTVEYMSDKEFSYQKEGLYHFRFDTNFSEGLTVVNFGPDFPKVKTPEELIEPLAYIATKVEYNDLLKSENKKLATDNFWLERAGTTGRAKELIRIYYNRVYFANYYFSGSKPGWKTDRGMVYVMYGPPQNMEKTATSETWIYYQGGAGGSIRFTFDYKPSKFDLDCFLLRHANSQDWYWKEAYDSWRSGKVYLQD